MSKRNGRLSKAIHRNTLHPSDQDLILLGRAVHDRFIEVLQLHLRITGEETAPPPELDEDMRLWRTMMVRHRKGDFRNTEDEKRSVRRVAEWTHRLNCTLRNQDWKPLVWKD